MSYKGTKEEKEKWLANNWWSILLICVFIISQIISYSKLQANVANKVNYSDYNLEVLKLKELKMFTEKNVDNINVKLDKIYDQLILLNRRTTK